MARNTNSELKRHIIYEFYAGLPNEENIIMETRGVVSGLHEVVTALRGKMEDQVLATCDGGGYSTETYTGKLKDFGLTSFFDGYDIELTISYSNGKATYNGGISVNKSFTDTKNGIAFSPFIKLNITGNDPSKIMKTISFCIGHELTHGYNLFEYARKNGLTVAQLNDNIDNTQRYGDIIATKDSPGLNNERAVGDILYKLNRMERNAYIAQLKQELESVSDEITDSKSAWGAVLNTESYMKFLNLEKNFNIMFNANLTDEAKKQLLYYTNRASGKDFKNYGQMKKFYGRYWETWKKKYLTMAAKIAYDVFKEHNRVLDGNMSTDFSIKP